jgi:hypothetical protein
MRNGAVVTGATGNPNGSRPAVWLNQIRYDTGAASGGQDIYDMSCMAGDYIDSPGTTGSVNLWYPTWWLFDFVYCLHQSKPELR